MPGKCEPSKCKSAGTGFRKAEAGYSSTFWISVHDRYGNQLPESTPEIKCWLEGPERIEAVVMAYPRGVYRVSYWVRTAGVYSLTVTCDGTNVLGTPKLLSVAPQRKQKVRSGVDSNIYIYHLRGTPHLTYLPT